MSETTRPGAGIPSTLSLSVSAATKSPTRQRTRRTVTGGLKNLPIAMPANELLNRALRTAKYLKVKKKKKKKIDLVD